MFLKPQFFDCFFTNSRVLFKKANMYPGVAELVARLLWEQDAASSSLATWTKSTVVSQETIVLLVFKIPP